MERFNKRAFVNEIDYKKFFEAEIWRGILVFFLRLPNLDVDLIERIKKGNMVP